MYISSHFSFIKCSFFAYSQKAKANRDTDVVFKKICVYVYITCSAFHTHRDVWRIMTF